MRTPAINMTICVTFLFLSSTGWLAAEEKREANVKLFEWERGLGIRSLDQPDMSVYLWFYEWNMFEAIEPGQHTGGSYKTNRRLSKDGGTGFLSADALTLEMVATTDGANLSLNVRNRTDYDFPPIAAIIPCFNPGPVAQRNPQFANTKTYFLSRGGLLRLNKREIHFNSELRDAVNREAKDGKYVWTGKWPLAEPDATGGLLVRESTDGKWVCGIAWEDFLSAQGHNPWQCMHLSIRVGPLKSGESRVIRGKIYLFPGNKDELHQRYKRDFHR